MLASFNLSSAWEGEVNLCMPVPWFRKLLSQPFSLILARKASTKRWHFFQQSNPSVLCWKKCHLFAQTYTFFPRDSTLFRQKQKAKGREGFSMGRVLTIGLLLTILCGCWRWCWWGCCSRLSIGTLVIAVATLLVVGTLLMTSGGKLCNTLKSSLQKAADIKNKYKKFPLTGMSWNGRTNKWTN